MDSTSSFLLLTLRLTPHRGTGNKISRQLTEPRSVRVPSVTVPAILSVARGGGGGEAQGEPTAIPLFLRILQHQRIRCRRRGVLGFSEILFGDRASGKQSVCQTPTGTKPASNLHAKVDLA